MYQYLFKSIVAGVLFLSFGCAHEGSRGPAPPGPRIFAPAPRPGAELAALDAPSPGPIPATRIDPFDLPEVEGPARPPGRRIDAPLPDEVMARLRREALDLPPSSRVQIAEPLGAATPVPHVVSDFSSLDFSETTGLVPPDPELAVGPDHVIAVVNASFEIYDRAGNPLAGPTTFVSFFSAVPACDGFRFDVNALYDEKEDRFFIGVLAGQDTYCFAVTATSNPLGTWFAYAFPTIQGAGEIFDYPHAGIGENGIFVGANIAPSPVRADVWRIDKTSAYAGAALPAPVRRTLTGDTPQPMNAHGFAQGTWPEAGPHYILTDHVFDGRSIGVWSWNADDEVTLVGTVDLDAATGVSAGAPVDFPQMGSAALLQANDWRVQDAEYRNGHVWMAHTIACNPGGGTVNCVRWAEIDPAMPAIVQAGVFGSDGEYRQFADLAVNHFGDMAIGYTKSSSALFPGIYYAGRLASDPPGTLRNEGLIKAGELAYASVPADPAPHRWGDYSGLTPDPGGEELCYLGEYSGDTGTAARWATWVGCLSFGRISADGFESGDCTGWSTTNTPCS